MKNLLVALFSIIALASCSTYESEVPLGNPGDTELDDKFLGKWILSEEKKTEEVSGHIEIIPFNRQEYLVQIIEYADSTDYLESILNFRMFPSKIKKDIYYNLQMLGTDEKSSFLIYKLKAISGNRYKLLYLAKDHFEKQFNSTGEFRKYVESNQKEFNKTFMTEGVLSRKVEK
ncbi:hypothetical protein [Marinifilum caeruleilacunae]|uniref:DUF4488 domain-containing protein n=1 Tax=Marinifilum caeruleilacunae TaxID=2499076 RepID=A0ABX1X002_9BACT|nr:hypothetical protein [Marinifilum caeruleilacunae]NOU61536.1 hypothetical protein [Marinifilum caeruleilacunae]